VTVGLANRDREKETKACARVGALRKLHFVALSSAPTRGLAAKTSLATASAAPSSAAPLSLLLCGLGSWLGGNGYRSVAISSQTFGRSLTA
jgi:hypothetical protein